jgi:hypothetical protein
MPAVVTNAKESVDCPLFPVSIMDVVAERARQA